MTEFRDRLQRSWPIALTPQVPNRLAHTTGTELTDAVGVADLTTRNLRQRPDAEGAFTPPST